MTTVEQVMGMGVVVDVRDAAVEEAAVDEVFDWLRFVDDTFSTYKPESEISRIGRGELSQEDAHPQVGDVLERCEQLREDTHGYFDSEAGGSLDPSGLVKGWAVDRAAEILEDAERATSRSTPAATSSSADVLRRGIAGTSASVTPIAPIAWRPSSRRTIWLSPRRAPMRAGSTCSIRTRAWPPTGLLSVTITGPELATADAYATAAFAMGARGPAWTAQLDGYEAMSILDTDTVLSTPGFPVAD